VSVSAEWRAAFPALRVCCLSGWWTIAGITLFLFHHWFTGFCELWVGVPSVESM